jgi:glycosyltransferase 2 family protein
MRKWIVGIVFLLSVSLLITSFGELERMADSLHRAKPGFLILALGAQIAWFINLGLTFRAIYLALGVRESASRLTLVAIAANFINVIAPTAGAGGMALFVTDGRKRGHSSGKVTAAGAISLFLDYLAFLAILILGLIVLFRRNNLDADEILASLLVLLITLILAIILYLGSQSYEKLSRLLDMVGFGLNRFFQSVFRRDLLNIESVRHFSKELSDGLSALPNTPGRLIVPFFLALINKAVLIVILLLIFLSFDVPFSEGTIIGGFAIGYLFTIISPTPAGIGVMEGMFVLALHSLRVEWTAAIVITLVYRAFTFWFSLGVGAVAFQYLAVQARRIVQPS